VFVGYPLYISAYRAGWYGRTLNIDSLIVLSTTCAYVYSTVIALASMADEKYAGETFFDTCAMVLLLISLGRFVLHFDFSRHHYHHHHHHHHRHHQRYRHYCRRHFLPLFISFL
jgi:cation transport ATPase